MINSDKDVIDLLNYRNSRREDLIDSIGAEAADLLRSQAASADLETTAIIESNIKFLLHVLKKTQGKASAESTLRRINMFVHADCPNQTC